MPGQYGYDFGRIEEPVESHPDGRWPSNVLLSDPELFDEPNPYVVGSGAVSTDGIAVNRNRPEEKSTYEATGYEIRLGPGPDAGYGGSGGYSRFFIVPKADRAERERGLTGVDGKRGNTHPTVKSLDLMRHLVRLVTPSGGSCWTRSSAAGRPASPPPKKGCAPSASSASSSTWRSPRAG